MKTIAYLRVSKDTQDVNNQKLAILEFAQKEKIEIHQFIELSISSRKTTKERKIEQLLAREASPKATTLSGRYTYCQ